MNVVALMDSAPAMFNIFLLLTLIFAVFGITAITLWQGMLRGRCYFRSPSGLSFVMDQQDEDSCALPTSCDPARVATDAVCGAQTYGRVCGPIRLRMVPRLPYLST